MPDAFELETRDGIRKVEFDPDVFHHRDVDPPERGVRGGDAAPVVGLHNLDPARGVQLRARDIAPSQQAEGHQQLALRDPTRVSRPLGERQRAFRGGQRTREITEMQAPVGEMPPGSIGEVIVTHFLCLGWDRRHELNAIGR